MTKIKLLPCLCAMLTIVSAAFGEADQQSAVNQGEVHQQPLTEDKVAVEKAKLQELSEMEKAKLQELSEVEKAKLQELSEVEKAKLQELSEKLHELTQKYPEKLSKVQLRCGREIVIGKGRYMPMDDYDEIQKQHPEMSDDEIWDNWDDNPTVLHSAAISSQARVQ